MKWKIKDALLPVKLHLFWLKLLLLKFSFRLFDVLQFEDLESDHSSYRQRSILLIDNTHISDDYWYWFHSFHRNHIVTVSKQQWDEWKQTFFRQFLTTNRFIWSTSSKENFAWTTNNCTIVRILSRFTTNFTSTGGCFSLSCSFCFIHYENWRVTAKQASE